MPTVSWPAPGTLGIPLQRSAQDTMTNAPSNDTVDDAPPPYKASAHHNTEVIIDGSGGSQSSDAGIILFREADDKLGVCGRIANAMPDRRNQKYITHIMTDMVRTRVAAILCGYEGANDLDQLRNAPLKVSAQCHSLNYIQH